MQTYQPGNRTAVVRFLHMKMYIQSGAAFPAIAGGRQRQRERSTQLRVWDDDGGAQPRASTADRI